MNPLAYVIDILSFNSTDSRSALVLRKIYFGVCYNTTFPVNAMLAFGATAPYLLYLMYIRELTLFQYLSIVMVTLLSALAYNLIYIVNDYIDRAKDERLVIPKQSARHVLGNNYLVYSLGSYIIICGLVGIMWPGLIAPLLGYSFLMVALSVIHSHAGRLKVITIFVERFCKFCAPFALIYLGFGDPTVKTMLTAALLAYPFGFTLDYAYRGYLRDRINISSAWRYVTYLIYWMIVCTVVTIDGSQLGLKQSLHPLLGYLGLYFGLSLGVMGLARILPLGFLNKRYPERVANEKRRLLIYGITMIVAVIAGGLYVVAN